LFTIHGAKVIPLFEIKKLFDKYFILFGGLENKLYLCTVKQEMIKELMEADTYLVITENSTTIYGSMIAIAAMLATAADREPHFYEAMQIAIDVFNEYQIQKN